VAHSTHLKRNWRLRLETSMVSMSIVSMFPNPESARSLRSSHPSPPRPPRARGSRCGGIAGSLRGEVSHRGSTATRAE